jgi:hypothetical protein
MAGIGTLVGNMLDSAAQCTLLEHLGVGAIWFVPDGGPRLHVYTPRRRRTPDTVYVMLKAVRGRLERTMSGGSRWTPRELITNGALMRMYESDPRIVAQIWTILVD